MKHGVVYVPRAVVATPVRAAPSAAVGANVTGCTTCDANDVRTRRVLTALIGVVLVAAPSASAVGMDLEEPIVRPGPGQITVLGAPPGTDVRVLVGGDAVVAEGAVDLAGSLLFREVEPGPYTVEIEDAGGVTTSESPSPASTSRRPRTSTTTNTSTPASAT